MPHISNKMFCNRLNVCNLHQDCNYWPAGGVMVYAEYLGSSFVFFQLLCIFFLCMEQCSSHYVEMRSLKDLFKQN